jgi:streptogramin lyase
LLVALASLAFADPVWAAPTSVTEFTEGLAADSSPEDIVAGPDGNLWFTVGGSFAADSAIARVTPEGAITEYTTGIDPDGNPTDIALGPDGNLWFTERGSFAASPAIGRVTPDGTITEFSAGLKDGSRPREVVAGADGNLWFTDRASGSLSSPAIGRITPSGTITEFTIGGMPNAIAVGADEDIWFTYGGEGTTPAIGHVEVGEGSTTITLHHAGLNAGSNPWDITLGPDGNLWFADRSESTPAIGRVTPDGTITEFSAGLNADSEPMAITAGPDGNLWFADWKAAIGRVTPTGTITEFGVETEPGEFSTPIDIAAGADGNLWFTDYNAPAAVGKATTAGAIKTFDQAASAEPLEIVSGPEGTLWFTDPGRSAVGRIVPGDDSEPAQPQSPAPEVAAGPPRFGWVSFSTVAIPVGKRGQVAFKLTCSSSVTCTGSLTVAGTRLRMVGQTSFSIPAGKTTVVRTKLVNKWQRFVAIRKRFNARLYINETFPGALGISQKKRIRLVPSS